MSAIAPPSISWPSKLLDHAFCVCSGMQQHNAGNLALSSASQARQQPAGSIGAARDVLMNALPPSSSAQEGNLVGPTGACLACLTERCMPQGGNRPHLQSNQTVMRCDYQK